MGGMFGGMGGMGGMSGMGGMGGRGGPSVFSFGNDEDEELPGMFSSNRRHHRGHGGQGHPPPEAENVKRKLPVSLEELFTGFQKKLKVTKQIQDSSGAITTASNVITVDGKPGWKAGTKITFPGVSELMGGCN